MNEYERGTNVKRMKEQHVARNRTANDNQRTNYWENTGEKKICIMWCSAASTLLKVQGKGKELKVI